jgi:thiamine-phosphate pyrophosphorylase
MHTDISPAVERALEKSRSESSEGLIDAIRLLSALLEDEEGRAALSLIEAGGDLDSIRTQLTKHPPLSFHLPTILDGARDIMGERHENTLTGEILTLGLLSSQLSLHPLLAKAGVKLDRLFQSQELPPIEYDLQLDLRDPSDVVSSARALDVNANRAREACRILDDYCRFVLDDAVLTGEVKNLRHDLNRLLNSLPDQTLLQSRETLRDVGTSISTASEMIRQNPLDIARINSKRLQESLRSLEEFGKIFHPEFAQGIEALRYRAYTIDRAIDIGAHARTALQGALLYVLLTGSQSLASLDWTIREAADGGAAIFQLREKDLSDRDLLERARNVRRWTRETSTLFILNDRPDIARLVGADGLHLGQDDMPIKEARQILGPGLLIGVSTHSPDQVRQAILDGADYIGVGPTFTSSTKQFTQLAGLDYVREAMKMTSLPAFAIGGINETNIGQVAAAGAKRVAVSAAVAGAEDPRLAAVALKSALQRA